MILIILLIIANTVFATTGFRMHTINYSIYIIPTCRFKREFIFALQIISMTFAVNVESDLSA